MESMVEKLDTDNMISIVSYLGSWLRCATLRAKQFGLCEIGFI
jgi:hypothetical protein